jgi:hypothetical protein
VAQLVEHHLAKVRVAGSNPVVRSERVSPSPDGEQCSPVEWPRGEATDCKSVYTGSNPVSTSAIGRHIPGQRLAEKPQVRGQKRVAGNRRSAFALLGMGSRPAARMLTSSHRGGHTAPSPLAAAPVRPVSTCLARQGLCTPRAFDTLLSRHSSGDTIWAPERAISHDAEGAAGT